ncbi:TNT domain-containing protein [Streptomyces sp. NPDC005526]|uniref:TNT domain-containing protein n=1 Tax=Streptomyces sp. NPDC005526 TaxID=3156885 RepID=UPI0033B73218
MCRGLVPITVPPEYRVFFFCGDWRLGPRQLPTQGLLGDILEGYDRLGGLTAVHFLDRWWDPIKEDWRYPRDDGFARNAQGPIAAPTSLEVGQLVDRFGNESGRFLSPAGVKFGQRAIPPSNLNTEDPRFPNDYHLYKVAKAVTVCAGPAAPAFEQPGGGLQYATSSDACSSPSRVTVGNLVANGTLVPVAVPFTEGKSMPLKRPAGVKAAAR